MSETNSTVPPNTPQDFSSCSMESMLSIPTQYILHKTQSGKNMHLFSRSEVSTLIQVSMLASELDIVLSLVYESLDRTNRCKSFREHIESGNGSLYLRALLPLLDVHAQTAEGALSRVTSESIGMHHILNSLDLCAVELKKFSEQNWNMAEQLSYMMPDQPNQLSKEKKVAAELEDAIAERIAHVRNMSAVGDENNSNQDEYAPIEEYCKSLFSEITQQSEMGVDPSASQMNAAQALALLAAKSEES